MTSPIQSISNDAASSGSDMATACGCETPRRGFLSGLLALGASAALPGCVSPAGPEAFIPSRTATAGSAAC